MSEKALNDDEVAALWEGNARAWTQQARQGIDVFRDHLNTPAFLAMLPPVDTLRGLDVGCGEGANTRQLATLGARMSAIDIAPTFVRNAREFDLAHPSGIDFCVGDGMRLPFEANSFDFVTAFMSLMDMPHPEKAIREAARVLRPGGFLQFSILHPCFMPPHRRVLRDSRGVPRTVEIGDYFSSTAGRVDRWWFSSLTAAQRDHVEPFRTPIFHHTLAHWVCMIVGAGLVIEEFAEPSTDARHETGTGVLAETRVAPISLQVRARMPKIAEAGKA